MSDSGLSRAFLRALHRRCLDDLDDQLVVYVCRARPYVVLVAIGKWNAKTVGTTFIERNGWERCGRILRSRIVADFIRRVAAENAALAGDPVLPEDFSERFPAIAEFLRLGKYPDGTPRRRSAITLMAGDGEGFKCVLNDPDNSRGVWATARSLEGLFVALEALASDPKAPWKPSNNPNKRK